MTIAMKRQVAPDEAAEPRKRQPEATRRRILDAALAEFAGKGLAGAKIDEIARRAGINKRMLYAYFGSKEALWVAVLERVYGERRAEEALIDVERLDPVEGMRRLVAFNFRYCAEHPEFIALLNNENLHGARHLRGSKTVAGLHGGLIATMERLLARGAKAGLFRRGLDAVQLYVTIASLAYFYFSNIHTLSVVFGRDLKGERARRARETHVVSVVLGYLRPDGEAAAD